MSRLRARAPSIKLVIAGLVATLVVVSFGTGLWSSPSAEPTVQEFLLDWQDHDYAAAAALTTGNHTEVAKALAGAYHYLDAAAFSLSMGSITQQGSTTQAYFKASVDLGRNGAPWNYRGRFSLRRNGSQWQVEWAPTVINPGLRPGLHIAVVSIPHLRQSLQASDGRPLLTPSTVYVVGVRPHQLKDAAATAAGLAQVTGLEPSELLGAIQTASPSKFQELVTLQPSQYQQMASALHKVPGLLFVHPRRRLFTSVAPTLVGSVGTEMSPALVRQGIAYHPGATIGLTGLQYAYQPELGGTPDTEIVTEDKAGHRVAVLATWPGRRPTAVRTTLQLPVQAAATKATAAPGSTAIVAVQASTGRILAVAARNSSGEPVIDPLDGKYPPGTAFTIVSGEALLATGKLKQNIATPILCQSTNKIAGQTFRNVPSVRNLGPHSSFAEDYAHACGTAFFGLSFDLTAQDLDAAAARFGLGARWQLPLPAFSGSVPTGGETAQVAFDTVGEGGVEMSPLAMAMTAAQVDTGTSHSPSLVIQSGDPQRARQVPVSAATLATLRELMGEAVSSGAAQRAKVGREQVFGQVGTAQVPGGSHPQWAHWFVGYRGDLAFAVLNISASPSPSVSAALIARRFLASDTGR
ncbi:MAG TPA: penicillin-binding transpeptidase domain-containing protein [Streptosporangiaceae bacterium]|nr:penicillin-binding transpeptidase domain-containing protein [Streptosporangiaceae bacterium]